MTTGAGSGDYATEIERLERRLLEPAARRSAAELDVLLDDDFREIGASGRTWDKRATIAALADDTLASAVIHDFAVQWLAPEVALATYRLESHRDDGEHGSLRSSLWARRGGRWRLVFHQGTRVAPTE